MSYIKNFKIGTLILLAAIVIASVTSCSNDDDTEEPIYHQDYVQGKLNDQDIAINGINGNILAEKSDFDFSAGTPTHTSRWFDWEVKLIETKDSIVTLHLHLDDIDLTNEMIYSPNDKDPIHSKSTCYATVKDLKNNTTSIYHPTHSAPINIAWRTFMMTVDRVGDEFKNLTKQYNYQLDFVGYRWPGIEGDLYGTLTSDDASQSPLKIKMKFTLY